MFAGIVETKAKLLKCTLDHQNIRIEIEKPINFNDLSVGDSVSVNGICLTIEAFSETAMQFCLAAETLRITGWSEKLLAQRIFNAERTSNAEQTFNLERSLRFGDRIHGHLVSGHVDAMGVVHEFKDIGGSRILKVSVPSALISYFWRKGSAAINGVSLTVNDVSENKIEFCLIPETLRRTNLAELAVGDSVTVEVDSLARAINAHIQQQSPALATKGQSDELNS